MARPDRSDPAALLIPLIELRSAQPHDDERPLARHLEAALAARGADEVVRVDVPRPGAHGAYVYARWGRPRLLLNAHLDTVPPGEGWQGDPFVARVVSEDGGRVVGLGAADTKGAIAAILAALDEVRPRELAVLLSGDEEHGGTCLRAFLDGPHGSGLERAVVFEPTGCRVGTRHRGILSVDVRLRGQGGHSSRADTIPAPLADLARVAAAWADWGRERRDEGPEGFRGLCLNIARLDGGVAFNVVPEEARLVASVRPPPGADPAKIRAALAAAATRVVPGIQLEFPIDNPPFATRELAAFADFPPTVAAPPVDLAFWTEAALLQEAGIDAIVYGPGDIAQAHAPGEWVSLRQLDQARADVAVLLATHR